MYHLVKQPGHKFLLLLTEAIIGFEKSVYSVTEMEPSTLVEVCINVTNGLSLDHGYGSAIINLITHTGTAAG